MSFARTSSPGTVTDQKKKPLKFTVDSALLRELGERLVGKPHIALAELVKNSYDADAKSVIMRFLDDRIEVSDNGHGMSFDEFRAFWMRIGSPHKQEQRFSRYLHRPLTGSKGVGRLAVQFLAKVAEVRTVSVTDASVELDAFVDWSQAVQAGELTEATALYVEVEPTEEFPGESPNGTTIVLANLNQPWTDEEIVGLAQEIWWLQPPFRANPNIESDGARDFTIELESADRSKINEFEAAMGAYLNIWHARLVGHLDQVDRSDPDHPVGRVRLTLEFAGGEILKHEYHIADCFVESVIFEIRTYYLVGRQKYGLKVSQIREYLENRGGVHIYDAGFHLPYYGAETDWLNIEIAHSHRLSRSKLLPEELQVPEGLTFLPTNSRLFGVVHVDTSRERAKAAERGAAGPGSYLDIQVTRDRLVDNKSFQSLRQIVRWALDFYAMEEAKRRFVEADANRPIEPVSRKLESIEDVLKSYEEDIPPPVFMRLKSRIREAIRASESEAEAVSEQMRLLGPLATAGMCTVAYEHEVGKQFNILENLVRQIGRLKGGSPDLQSKLNEISAKLLAWIEHARATRYLFTHLLSPEDLENRARLRVAPVIEDVKKQVAVLTRGVLIDTAGISRDLRFPEGTVAEWSAIFQNAIINAANAMLDSPIKKIAISSRSRGPRRSIVMQDTGVGVDLATADELFKPFVRKLKLSEERRRLELGGSGLGLSIVRIIAEGAGCRVGFIEPVKGYSTAFELSWKESD